MYHRENTYKNTPKHISPVNQIVYGSVSQNAVPQRPLVVIEVTCNKTTFKDFKFQYLKFSAKSVFLNSQDLNNSDASVIPVLGAI